MKRTYLVVFEKAAEDNWGAVTPDIRGAVGAGESLDIARHSVLEAIHIQLDYLAENGINAPEAVTASIDFAEFDPERTDLQYVVEWLTVELPEVSIETHEHAQQAA
jgi:predicted RNase H-like HicB family nuclease